MIGTDIAQAVDWLTKGEAVGIPTETVYGLAANALSPEAVIKIFQIKERPSFDPLIVHIARKSDIDQYAINISQKAYDLIEAFWPGPLTLVLQKQEIIPDIVTSGLNTVGLRMPIHPLTRELLKALPFPLAAPSANPFGYISPTTAQHVEDQLGSKVPYILDGGSSTVGVESTIIGFEDVNSPVVYRFGGISVEEIESVIGTVKIKTQGGDNPKAPGQLSSHYAGSTPLIVTDDIQQEINAHPGKRIVILNHGPSDDNFGYPAVNLSQDGTNPSIAINLFKIMRQVDHENFDLMIMKPVPDTGIGRAINDRIARASFRG